VSICPKLQESGESKDRQEKMVCSKDMQPTRDALRSLAHDVEGW